MKETHSSATFRSFTVESPTYIQAVTCVPNVFPPWTKPPVWIRTDLTEAKSNAVDEIIWGELTRCGKVAWVHQISTPRNVGKEARWSSRRWGHLLKGCLLGDGRGATKSQSWVQTQITELPNCRSEPKVEHCVPLWRYLANTAASLLTILPFQIFVLSVCSGWISAAGINILSQSNSGKEEIYYLTVLGHSPSLRETGTKTQNRNATLWLMLIQLAPA